MSHDPSEVTERKQNATFRDLFRIGEYRAVYSSLVVSMLGDYLARAAVTTLVYQRSDSVLLSAAAFAVSFLPWVIGGTLLSALAERYPYRRVLIVCDLIRMTLIAVLLVPHLPIWSMLVVLFLASLGTPPAQASRSAILPLLVGRDKLPMALATNATTGQASQVVGYLLGAALATGVNPQTALGIDVVAFAVSAALIATGVRPRPAAKSADHRTHLLRESGEGFRIVFGRDTLRPIVIMVFVLTMFAIVPEGLAAAWAAESGSADAAGRGLDQGMIMAAGPIGFVIGGLLVSRLVDEAGRHRLIRPLAVVSALALVPAIAGPPPAIVAAIVAVSGVAQGGLSPTLNAKFALIIPHGYRARAFGVVATGMQLSQFLAVIVTGWLADRFWLPLVVGLWSIGGTIAMAVLAARWPSEEKFAAAIEEAAASQPVSPPPAAASRGPASPGQPSPTQGVAPEMRTPTTSVTPERP